MGWNHRVIHRIVRGEHWYATHEVYYDDDGKPEMVSTEETEPGGETVDDLRAELSRFKKALDQPVLEYDSFTPNPNEDES